MGLRTYKPLPRVVNKSIDRLRRADWNARPRLARRLPWSAMTEQQRQDVIRMVGRKQRGEPNA